MSDAEYFEWRLFYPLATKDINGSSEKHLSMLPYTLNTKLNMFSITEDKHRQHSSYIDMYYILDSTDVCLKIHNIDKLNNFKIEIEIRNRNKEQQESSLIQYWTVYEVKTPYIDLPEKILNQLNQSTIKKIDRYLQRLINNESNHQLIEMTCIHVKKDVTIWQMDDSDRKIEESDIYLMMDDASYKAQNDRFSIPKYWRTLSIQTSDYDRLVKTLTALQIEDDKDLLDYFSFLISQTCFNSFSTQHQQQLLSGTISTEKSYINLLTMSYISFIELMKRIQQNQTST